MIFLGLSLLGIFVGFISGFFGVGGGTILVPALLYLGFDIKYAIGISVMQMVFSSVFGSYLNFKKGSLDIKSSFVVGMGGFTGAFSSGYIVDTLSSATLAIIFMVFVLFSIYRFFKTPVVIHKEEIDNSFLLFAIGFVIGAFAISIGIGGALLLTPVLVGFLHFDLKKAVSTALFFVVFSSLSGSISLAYYGYVDILSGLTVGIFSLIGVYFGVHVAHKTDAKRLKSLILILNVIVFILILNKL